MVGAGAGAGPVAETEDEDMIGVGAGAGAEAGAGAGADDGVRVGGVAGCVHLLAPFARVVGSGSTPPRLPPSRTYPSVASRGPSLLLGR